MKDGKEFFISQQENKETNELVKYESAIRKFLKEQKPNNPDKVEYDFGDFDISDPREGDIVKMQSGDFEITNFRTTKRPNSDKSNLRFYIGKTELHIFGKAADRIYELMG